MSVRRVALISSSTSWGGTEKWTLRTAEELQQAGVRVTLILRDPEQYRSRMRVEVPIVPLRMRNDGDVISLLHLTWWLHRRADLVIPTRVRDYWLGGLAARIAGKPNLLRLGVVRTLRQHHPMDFFRYGLLPKAILVNARAIRDALLSTSWIEPETIHVVYNGVDAPGRPAESTLREWRTEHGIAPGDTLVVGAGRLAVEKRWDWLVRASAQLIREGHPLRVLLFGEGSERRKLEELIRTEGVGGQVSLPGESRHLDEWFGAADLVPLPSSNEGISNTMLEAMGHAAPLVATRSGGVEEHFEDEQQLLLAGTDDFAGFVNRYRRLASDPLLRRRLGEAGWERTRERFSWDRMTSSLISLMDRVTGGGA